MAEAQRKRWQTLKGESPTPEGTESKPAKTKRRKMSAAGRKAVGDATRARWAAKRAAEQAPAKKTTSKKSAAKKAPAKTAKKVAPTKKAVKKSTVKKTASVAAPAVVEAAV
jgi:hypothetical protein